MVKPLPKGWRRVRLGEVLVPVNRFERLEPAREYRLLGVKWYAQGVFQREKKLGKDIAANQLNRVQTGDFVYNRLFAWKGSFAIVDDQHSGGFVSGEFPIFRAKNGEVVEEYLFRYFSCPSTWDQAGHESTGTTSVSRKRWKEDQFLELVILLPPIPEQHRIVDALGTVDAAIRANEEVIEKTRDLKRSLANELLTRGIPGRHKRFKDSPIGKIPVDWEVKRFGDFCPNITVGIVVKPKALYVPSGVPCLRSLNVREDRIDPNNMIFISKEANKLHSKSRLKTGDVVAVRTGEPGISAIIPESLNGSNCIDLIIIRPPQSIIGEFISRYLNSDRAKISIKIQQGGGAQQHLNIGALRNIFAPLPPRTEQSEIIDALTSVDLCIADHSSAFAAIQKSSIDIRHHLIGGLSL